MPDTIKLDTLKVSQAFEKEANRMKDGDHSRFLPGFTDLRIVSNYDTVPGAHVDSWDDCYIATRLRDGKVYGYVHSTWSESLSDNPFTVINGVPSSQTVTFVEMVQKTVTLSYFTPVK